VWPDLREIKNIVAEFLSLLWCHGLLLKKDDKNLF
jgi:hypothetical protein